MSSEERDREPEKTREVGAEEPLEEPLEQPIDVPGEEDPSVVAAPDENDPPDGTEPDDVIDASEVEVVEESGEPVAEEAAVEVSAEELEATRLERDQYRDDMMYLRAEFDNVRKRQEREMERVRLNASESLVRELLPVLDNLERALEVEGDVREGVKATLDQFASVLGGEGLTPVPSDGHPFDPNIHEAVMSEHSEEHEENIVLKTFQRGYTLNGKPIRTAKVVVAR